MASMVMANVRLKNRSFSNGILPCDIIYHNQLQPVLMVERCLSKHNSPNQLLIARHTSLAPDTLCMLEFCVLDLECLSL